MTGDKNVSFFKEWACQDSFDDLKNHSRSNAQDITGVKLEGNNMLRTLQVQAPERAKNLFQKAECEGLLCLTQ